MALTEEVSYTFTVCDPHKTIELCTITKILRDGVELTRAKHVDVLFPGEDISSAPSEVQAVAAVLWTEQVVNTFVTSTQKAEEVAEIPKEIADLGLPSTEAEIIEPEPEPEEETTTQEIVLEEPVTTQEL